ncbi:rhodanese-like domain-containing protein [Metabacillus iocasae]|uniref:Rhodanese-related sulfurtransferase n=1 Tax=Priestia iocasae TaxID=2291674 RepID=A0ABS2QTL2_9BACI|nr:rhodanese-like domain-containing protein [Metabacillus iocasae]MBM7702819.1 rhodanese-related sulfurtransferase [Metabacillus iocasae]
MEYIQYVLFGLVAFFLLRRLLPTSGVRNMTTTQLKNELGDKNKQYIDVRTPGEFKGRNIRGFKNIPLQQLPNRVNELSKEKEVVVICQSGMRSNAASRQLVKHGFKNVTNVKGGMNAWR